MVLCSTAYTLTRAVFLGVPLFKLFLVGVLVCAVQVVAPAQAQGPARGARKQSGSSTEFPLQVCTNDYALCAASNCNATGKQIQITTNGVVTSFPEAECLCPIMHGPAVSSPGTGNMPAGNKCAEPVGQNGLKGVWSTYSLKTDIPQAPDWKKQGNDAKKTVCSSVPQGFAQCYSMACARTGPAIGPDGKPTGVELASCKCPINEGLNGQPVDPATSKVVTESTNCAAMPVAGSVPAGAEKKLKK
jgi:hypothetical protein